MEEFLAKQLLQSGLGVVGVLVLVYLLREVFQLRSYVTSEADKTTKLDKKVAVLTARLNFTQGFRRKDDVTNGDD